MIFFYPFVSFQNSSFGENKDSPFFTFMNLLFYLFSSLTLLSGIMVIQARNPVHSVLFLILVFFNAAGLLVLLGLDFFAMIFLVVYVGAIAVLFLFVVMMLAALAVAALAAVYPNMLVGPKGGSLAGY